MEKQRLFVDMDGTLAEFQRLDTLEKLYEPGYFRNLKPLMTVVQGIETFMQHYPDVEVYVLSAVLSDSKYALAEKQEWLDIYLPQLKEDHRIFCACGSDKKAAILGGITENDYILEDYTHNLSLWEPPGKGIKLLNGINNTHGTWQGSSIRCDNSPEMISDSIYQIMQGREIKESRTFKLNLNETTDYTILQQQDNYTLLGRHISTQKNMADCTPYIVAYNAQATNNGLINWEHGTYCASYEQAKEVFQEKTMTEEMEKDYEPDM